MTISKAWELGNEYWRHAAPVIVEFTDATTRVLLCPRCAKGFMSYVVRWREATREEAETFRSKTAGRL